MNSKEMIVTGNVSIQLITHNYRRLLYDVMI